LGKENLVALVANHKPLLVVIKDKDGGKLDSYELPRYEKWMAFGYYLLRKKYYKPGFQFEFVHSDQPSKKRWWQAELERVKQSEP
jgi:hypothetical protein